MTAVLLVTALVILTTATTNPAIHAATARIRAALTEGAR